MSTILVKSAKGSEEKVCARRAVRKAFTAGVSGKVLLGVGALKAAAERATREGISDGVQRVRVRVMIGGWWV